MEYISVAFFLQQGIEHLPFWIVAGGTILIALGLISGITKSAFAGLIAKTIKIALVGGFSLVVVYLAGLYLTDPNTDLRAGFEGIEFKRLLKNLDVAFEGFFSIILSPFKTLTKMGQKGEWAQPFSLAAGVLGFIALLVSMRHERFRPTRFFLILVGTGLLTAGIYFAGSSTSNFQDMLKNLNASKVWFPLVMSGAGIMLILASLGEEGDFIAIFSGLISKAVLLGIIVGAIWLWAGIRGVDLKGIEDIPAFVGGEITAQAQGDQCYGERQSPVWTRVFSGSVRVNTPWSVKLSKQWPGQELLICAKGNVSASSRKTVSPTGTANISRRYIEGEHEWIYPNGCQAYSLMLKVGTASNNDTDPIYCVGSKEHLTLPKGPLYLGIQDRKNRMASNQGTWEVEIFRQTKSCPLEQAWLCGI